MLGMEMILKSLGFDAAQLQAQAKAAIDYCNAQQKYFDDKMNLILANQKIIMDALNVRRPDNNEEIKRVN